MLKDVQAALAAAQANRVAPPPTTPALIPKPRGTSGRAGFNLAKEMNVDKNTCHVIQVRTTFVFSNYLLIACQRPTVGFCSLTREHVIP